MLDFVLVCASTVLVCASTVLVCASTVLVCASTVLVCASICFFVLARKSTRKHISFGDDSTHATYGTHMYIPVSVNTYVLIQDLAAAAAAALYTGTALVLVVLVRACALYIFDVTKHKELHKYAAAPNHTVEKKKYKIGLSMKQGTGGLYDTDRTQGL